MAVKEWKMSFHARLCEGPLEVREHKSVPIALRGCVTFSVVGLETGTV